MRRLAARLPFFDFARSYLAGDGLRALLIRGTGGTFALKVISTGLGFFTGLLLARLLGAAGFGVFAYTQSWVALLSLLATLGLNTLLVRAVATYRARSSWSLMRGLLRQANRMVLAASLVLASLAAAVAWLLGGDSDPQMLTAFLVSMTSLPFMALVYLRQGAMRGLQRTVTGYLPEMLIRPLLFVALIGVAYLLLRDDLSASWAVGANVVATAVAFFVGARLLRTALPQAVAKSSPLYESRSWMRSMLPLMFLGGMQVINAQVAIIALGAIKGAEAAGVYAAVSRGAGLVAFVLSAAGAALAPTFAGMYAAGNMERLQRLVTKSTRAILLFSVPMAVGLMLLNQWFLLLFGEEFGQGGAALIILSLGQLANAATGSVGTLLVMTGHERDSAAATGTGALLNVVLNLALIPIWGLEGAAIATAASLIIWNLLFVILVYRRLGIHASALGRINLGDRT